MSNDCGQPCVDTQDIFSTYVSVILLSISIASALCVLVTFIVFSDLRTYAIKLICYLCVCIIIGFSAFIAASEDPIPSNEGACISMAILVHFFFIANFCWTFCIAFNFYQVIVRKNREAQLLEKYYHVFCWGLPSGLVIGVGSAQEYGALVGTSSSQCWITDDLARFLTFFIPGLLIITSNSVLFFYIGREFHETWASAHKSDQRDRKKEFRVYLSIYVSIGLSWVFGYLMFLMPEQVIVTILLICFTIFTPLQGFFLFVFYCLQKKVYAKWAGLFGHCIPICKEWSEKWSATTSATGGSTRSQSGASSRTGVDSASSASRP